MKKKLKKSSVLFSRKASLRNNLSVPLIILSVAIAVFIIYYTTLSFLRFDNFYTGRLDLGNMTQTVWNTAHGRLFQMTHSDGVETVSRLAFHADFILMLFAPFYWIWESPKVLLFFQAAIAGFGALFVYLIANHVLKQKYLALTFAVAYLLYSPLGWSVLFDFHAVVLATTFLLGTVYFLLVKRYRFFLLFALLAALTKEQVWIVIAILGGILFFFQNKRKFGSVLFIGSLIIFYLLFWHAIPNAQNANNEYFALSYFNDDGGSITDLLKNSLMQPGETFTKLTSEERLTYLQALFMPLGYLSALFPFWLFFAGADFTLNLLSDKEELYQIYYHYTAVITPFVFLSAIYGVWVLGKVKALTVRVRHWKLLLIPYILLCSLYAANQNGPLIGTQNPNDEMIAYPLKQKNTFAKVLSEIPVENSVAASNELGAQLSHREHVYTLAIDIRNADYVAFFMRNPDQSEIDFNAVLINQLKADVNYELWYDKEGLLIYRKKGL